MVRLICLIISLVILCFLNKQEIFHNTNGCDYVVLKRNKKYALLESTNKNQYTRYVCAVGIPETNVGSWDYGHYYSTFEAANKCWEENYAE